MGETKKLEAIVSPTGAGPLEWVSDDPAVVAVSIGGVLTAREVGSAWIVVRLDQARDSARIEVGLPPRPSALPAFPGAEGYGALARGGWAGDVYLVDRLDDDPVAPEPGMLRHALMQTGPRTVIFGVAGRIQLESEIILRSEQSYLTIAGQTAPGTGVEFAGHLQIRSADHVVIRYVRLRSTGGNNVSILGGAT